MPILIGLGGLLLLAVVFGPQMWVKHILDRHAASRPDLPGTGGELARHLLDEADLHSVTVEETKEGDHYDPGARAVRLLPEHYNGFSVAAVAVAAHEVGHAVQHARGERSFTLRTSLATHLSWVDRAASVILLLVPVVFLIVKAPVVLVLQIVAAVLLLTIRILVHLVTLPVELDASFGKALPALVRGRYLAPEDVPGARQVLRAAAWTYVAGALVTLLDLARLVRVLRF